MALIRWDLAGVERKEGERGRVLLSSPPPLLLLLLVSLLFFPSSVVVLAGATTAAAAAAAGGGEEVKRARITLRNQTSRSCGWRREAKRRMGRRRRATDSFKRPATPRKSRSNAALLAQWRRLPSLTAIKIPLSFFFFSSCLFVFSCSCACSCSCSATSSSLPPSPSDSSAK
jgi:hypothetical protein